MDGSDDSTEMGHMHKRICIYHLCARQTTDFLCIRKKPFIVSLNGLVCSAFAIFYKSKRISHDDKHPNDQRTNRREAQEKQQQQKNNSEEYDNNTNDVDHPQWYIGHSNSKQINDHMMNILVIVILSFVVK